MNELKRRFIKCIILFCFLGIFSNSDAQALQDTTFINLLKRGVGLVYNMQFKEAERIDSMLTSTYPRSHLINLYRGLIFYWKNYPVLPSPATRVSFESIIQGCMDFSVTSDNRYDKIENILVSMCARGMLLTFYADNNLINSMFPIAGSTYKYLRLSFDYASSFPDFLFFTGLYNYYREAYPRAHPVFLPISILFPRGDMNLGLIQLKFASENAVLMNAESLYYMSIILTGYENSFQEALHYSACLHRKYPQNPEFLGIYIKNLLFMKHYDDAEALIDSTSNASENPFCKAVKNVFSGIIHEKKYHNLRLALDDYTKGAVSLEHYGKYGYELRAYAYYGLSRIYAVEGDIRNKKIYRKKASDLSVIKNVTFDD